MAWNEPGPGRDPWNQGGKRGEGPPDLDEMLKRLKARFGGKGRPPGSPGASFPAAAVALAVAALAILWSLTGWYVVDEQERAVVLRLGRYVGTTEPGPHWRWPWPIETAEVVNVTGVRTSRDTATVLTKDMNIVVLELSAQYRLSKVDDFVFNVSDPDKTLQQAIAAAVREVVGQSTMDFVLTDGRQQVADNTKQMLQARLDEYKTGLVVTEVNLLQAQAPEPVKTAFEDAIKAGEDHERLINEAKAYANDRIPRARGAAARQVAEATAYRDQTVARAEGDAARFTQQVVEYKKNPAVMRERLYLDTMSSVLSNNSKILLDIDKGAPLVYLPIEELLRNARSGDPGVDPATGTATRPGSGPGSSYDPSRSRERGR
jgi:membrane protease subunit HflK